MKNKEQQGIFLVSGPLYKISLGYIHYAHFQMLITKPCWWRSNNIIVPQGVDSSFKPTPRLILLQMMEKVTILMQSNQELISFLYLHLNNPMGAGNSPKEVASSVLSMVN